MFFSYITELKNRIFILIYAFIFNLIFCTSNLEILLYISTKPISKFKGFNFIFTEISNAFTCYLNLLVIYSLLLTLPFLILNIFYFLTPSLYKYEHSIIKNLLFISLSLFLFTFFFINLIFLPNLLTFFFKFEITQYPFNIFFEGRIDTYLSFFIKIYYMFLIIFQFPIWIYFFFTINILNIEMLSNHRKIFYFIFLILAALITPPDLISQIIMIIPFILFFEITLKLIILLKNYKQKNEKI